MSRKNTAAASFRERPNGEIGRRHQAPKWVEGRDSQAEHFTHWTPAAFRDEPWFDDPKYGSEYDLSMIAGRHTVSEAVSALWGRAVRPTDSARAFRVNELRSHGYRCLDTPSAKNPKHTSVMAPIMDRDLDLHIAWWRAPDRVRLSSIQEEVPR